MALFKAADLADVKSMASSLTALKPGPLLKLEKGSGERLRGLKYRLRDSILKSGKSTGVKV